MIDVVTLGKKKNKKISLTCKSVDFERPGHHSSHYKARFLFLKFTDGAENLLATLKCVNIPGIID